MKRILIAFFIAPLTAVPTYTICCIIAYPKDFMLFIQNMFSASIYVLPVAYAVTFTLGLPSYFLLNNFKLANSYLLTLLGIPLPLFAISIFNNYSGSGLQIEMDMATIGLFSLCGMSVSGAAVFLINFRKDVDRNQS